MCETKSGWREDTETSGGGSVGSGIVLLQLLGGRDLFPVFVQKTVYAVVCT